MPNTSGDLGQNCVYAPWEVGRAISGSGRYSVADSFVYLGLPLRPKWTDVDELPSLSCVAVIFFDAVSETKGD